MKKFSPKQIENLHREHKQYNREMRQIHCHRLQKSYEEFVAYRYGKYTSSKKSLPLITKEEPVYQRTTEHVPSMNSLGKHSSVIKKKEERVYTGTLIKGIGTMHKSNAVPVINNNVAKDLSSMRR
tara:strand:+ start:234 stop:608 length:375 start_codon:yes stop_codon:yes gene_type:complete